MVPELDESSLLAALNLRFLFDFSLDLCFSEQILYLP